MFSAHTTPEEFENATITDHSGFCLGKTRSGKSNHYLEAIVLEKLAFTNFFGLKSVFEKLRFRDGLVWTVGLTVERSTNKAIFSISPANFGRGSPKTVFCLFLTCN